MRDPISVGFQLTLWNPERQTEETLLPMLAIDRVRAPAEHCKCHGKAEDCRPQSRRTSLAAWLWPNERETPRLRARRKLIDQVSHASGHRSEPPTVGRTIRPSAGETFESTCRKRPAGRAKLPTADIFLARLRFLPKFRQNRPLLGQFSRNRSVSGWSILTASIEPLSFCGFEALSRLAGAALLAVAGRLVEPTSPPALPWAPAPGLPILVAAEGASNWIRIDIDSQSRLVVCLRRRTEAIVPVPIRSPRWPRSACSEALTRR